MQRTYNFNLTNEEALLICQGLSELQVKTGAADLISKLQTIARSQDEIRQRGEGDIEVSSVGSEKGEI